MPSSGRVEAALRSLERAPGHVLDTVLTIAESLAQRQRAERHRNDRREIVVGIEREFGKPGLE